MRLPLVSVKQRAALKRGVVSNGYCMMPGTFSAEIFGSQGFDCVTVDLQHGLIGCSEAIPMLQLLSRMDVTPLVRVPSLDEGIIMKMLDAGAMAETEGKPSKLEPLAKVILKGAREMVREPAMSDSTFAEIKTHLSDEHMVDLVLTIAFYCGVVRVLATMKIDNEPYYKEVLQQYPIPGVN